MPTIRRGARRAIAAEQREKHAQRTTLPVKDADAAPKDNLDSLGLPELRQLAVAQGWSTLTKAGKAAIIKALRENPNGPRERVEQRQAAVDGVESKPSAQVDPKRCKEIGERMVAERKKFTRGLLAEAAGTTPSIIWRWEQQRCKPDELVMVEALFAKIDAGQLTAPERKVFGQPQSGPTKTALKSTLDEVQHILSEAPATGAKVAQLRAVINNALDVIERATKSDDN